MERVRLWIFGEVPGRVRAFHQRVFGWPLTDDGSLRCWLVTDDDNPRPGIDGPVALPGAGRTAYLADTEGNVIGIMQDDDPPPRAATTGQAPPDLDSPSPRAAGASSDR